MVNTVTAAMLDSYLGKSIGQICENVYDDPQQNHCAHFVSHVLGLKHGKLCGDLLSWPQQKALKRETKGSGGSTRCNELYNRLLKRGDWASIKMPTDGILIFATPKHNVAKNRMGESPQKHVGIIMSGKVYNYGNTDRKVRVELTVEAFRARIANAYRDPNIGLYYGVPE